MLLAAVDDGRLARPRQESDDRETAELAEVERLLRDLAEDLGAGRITRSEWLAAREQAERRRARLASAVAGAATAVDVTAAWSSQDGRLRAAWPSLPADRQNAIMRAVFASVTIGPSNRRKDETAADRVVAVDWRA